MSTMKNNYRILLTRKQLYQIVELVDEELSQRILAQAESQEFDKVEYYKKYYLAHKEEIAQKQKKYRLANSERISEYNKKWQEKNKERLKEKYKKYYKENKEKIKKRVKMYKQKNKLGRLKYEENK